MKGKPHTYLIIGCGGFGSRAASKLFQRDPYSKIIVVDKNRKALQKIFRLPTETVLSDRISHLSKFISEGGTADYIIPAVPIHLTFEFILYQYQILKDLKGSFESRVIRSQQLGPGIGGFQPKTLLDLLEDMKKKKKSGQFILIISTASRCHGVTSALASCPISLNTRNKLRSLIKEY